MLKNRFEIIGNIVWVYLTKGHKTCIDLRDWSRVKNYKWFTSTHSTASTVYAATTVKTKQGKWVQRYLHSFIMGGRSAKVIDHIDNCGLNNTRKNLRFSSHAANLRNASLRKTNKSGYKLIFFDKNTKKWAVNIRVGSFKTLAEAVRARNKVLLYCLKVYPT